MCISCLMLRSKRICPPSRPPGSRNGIGSTQLYNSRVFLDLGHCFLFPTCLPLRARAPLGGPLCLAAFSHLLRRARTLWTAKASSFAPPTQLIATAENELGGEQAKACLCHIGYRVGCLY